MFVTVEGLATGRDVMLDMLADVARNATFPADEVELEKTNALQGLTAEEATPEFAVDKAFGVAVFGDHPYRFTSPERSALEAVTPELLRGEQARRFRPERALLVIAGASTASGDGERASARTSATGRRRRAAPGPVPAGAAGRPRDASSSSTAPARCSRRSASAGRRSRSPTPTTSRCWSPTRSSAAPSPAGWCRTSARRRATPTRPAPACRPSKRGARCGCARRCATR